MYIYFNTYILTYMERQNTSTRPIPLIPSWRQTARQARKEQKNLLILSLWSGLVWAHHLKGNGFCGKLDLFLLSLLLSFGCLNFFFFSHWYWHQSTIWQINQRNWRFLLFLLHDSYYVVDKLPFELWEVNVNVTFNICFLSTLFLHNLDLLISL